MNIIINIIFSMFKNSINIKLFVIKLQKKKKMSVHYKPPCNINKSIAAANKRKKQKVEEKY